MTTRRGAAGAFAALGAGLVLLAGCRGESGVKTYPVTGKVIVKNGDVARLAGGFVRLESVADPNVKAVGEIQEDGSFGLGSFVQDRPLTGVPEGEYRARVEPRPQDEADEGSPAVVRKGDLLPKYRDFGTSGLKYTIAPGENTITVEVEVRR
ncbi:MAG TPA: hypothetical protein VKE74_02835 [Gemmataceae bacterium]|nr:hypothetical protein [Gemmataceae bacterium]